MISRRSLLATLAAGSTGCVTHVLSESADARLRSRPGEPGKAADPGLRNLEFRRERDTLLYIPEAARKGPLPLFLYLHGATGSEQQGINRFRGLADQFGFALLSPASAGSTWDAIRGVYATDIRLIDRALKATFDSCRIDAGRIAVGGFSDGASYGLGVGHANGDLFRSVLAFSPGFIPGSMRNGRARIFISHGKNDHILPFDSTSRHLVPELKSEGYDVTFREFDGPHTVPREIAIEAIQWFLG